MSGKLPNYLRCYRKHAALTQTELAFLMGAESSNTVSRLERYTREPNLHFWLASQVIFRADGQALFPAIYTQVELTILERAQLLKQRIEQMKPDQWTIAKLQFLHDVLNQTELIARPTLWRNNHQANR